MRKETAASKIDVPPPIKEVNGNSNAAGGGKKGAVTTITHTAHTINTNAVTSAAAAVPSATAPAAVGVAGGAAVPRYMQATASTKARVK